MMKNDINDFNDDVEPDDSIDHLNESITNKHLKKRNLRRMLEQRIEEKRLKREIEDDYS